MLASRAGIEKRNAVGNDQHANTVRTVKLLVIMRMGNVTELESKLVHCALCARWGITLTNIRQLGNMTWKAEEYEKLLRELCQRVEGADQILIRKTLEMVSRSVQIIFVHRP